MLLRSTVVVVMVEYVVPQRLWGPGADSPRPRWCPYLLDTEYTAPASLFVRGLSMEPPRAQ